MHARTIPTASTATAFVPASYFRSYAAANPTPRERFARSARALALRAAAGLRSMTIAISRFAAALVGDADRCASAALSRFSAAIRHCNARIVEPIADFLSGVTFTPIFNKVRRSPVYRFAACLLLTLFSFTSNNLSVSVNVGKGLAYAAGATALMAGNAGADIINVLNIPATSDIGMSEMKIKNTEGGKLGADSGDSTAWPERPPGSPDNWLRVYSDQWNQFYGVSGYPLRVDNRPFSGTDANQPFPLVLDTQGPDAITSSNNYIQFQLQDGPDIAQGRGFYGWMLSFVPGSGASFTDGTTTKSGVWNLSTDTTINLPPYNLSGTQGKYGDLMLTIVPEPGTGLLLLLGASSAFLIRHRRRAHTGSALDN